LPGNTSSTLLPGLQEQLHDRNVEQTAEFEADFLQDANDRESQGFVQPYAHGIVGRDAAKKRVVAQSAPCLDKRLEKLLPDPLSPVLLGHIDRHLHGAIICRAVGPAAEGRPSAHCLFRLRRMPQARGRDEDGMCGVMVGKPLRMLLVGPWLRVVGGGGRNDLVIVNRERIRGRSAAVAGRTLINS